MIETLVASGEFEQKPNREVERTYLPLFPERLERFKTAAYPIEQIYVSHPVEEFSLRLREAAHDGGLAYTAAIKSQGEVGVDGLDRFEAETVVDAATYHYYKERDSVTIRKLRAEPFKNIVIDWFEDGHIQVESEHPLSWVAFLEQHGLDRAFADITGDNVADNEWRAHLGYRRGNQGNELLVPKVEIDPETISRELWTDQLKNNFTVATISGRSGSGKSTVIQTIQEQLTCNGIESLVLSTDDYHRGKTWLEQYNGGTWTEWDEPIVYDVRALQADIKRLREGESISQRRFDFTSEEPVYSGVVEPKPVILVEGIYAKDPSFDAMTRLRYELPTPFATCVGRRLLCDQKERPQFADVCRSLRYILEHAEPAYARIAKH